LIEPYKEQQLFVRQSLAAFLRMLNLMAQDEQSFEQISSDSDAEVAASAWRLQLR
jgi:hypothetical protein